MSIKKWEYVFLIFKIAEITIYEENCITFQVNAIKIEK